VLGVGPWPNWASAISSVNLQQLPELLHETFGFLIISITQNMVDLLEVMLKELTPPPKPAAAQPPHPDR
jgi:hypothetical protein